MNEFDYLKDRRVALLDVPDHTNIGDHMIFLGELVLLKEVNTVLTQISAVSTFNKNISKGDIILLNGGGNFGDLYPKHQNFRHRIIKLFPQSKIVVFPQSVFFENEDYLKKSIEIFSSHKNVTIYARDEATLTFLKKHYKKNIIKLLPDMAFMLRINHKLTDLRRTLYLERTDKELAEIAKVKDATKSDWLTYEKIYYLLECKTFKIFQFFFFLLSLALPILRRVVHLDYIVYSKHMLRTGLKYFRNYDKVITTRLHGHILATLMGLPNLVLDNSYGKNKNFVKTWTKDITTTKLYNGEQNTLWE